MQYGHVHPWRSVHCVDCYRGQPCSGGLPIVLKVPTKPELTLEEALEDLIGRGIEMGRANHFVATFRGERVGCKLIADGRAHVLCQAGHSRVMHRWVEETHTIKVWEETICEHCGHINHGEP